jgi:hypothetical protein
MTLFRTIASVLLLGATILAGPNLPAQGLAALREMLFPIARRVWSGLKPS